MKMARLRSATDVISSAEHRAETLQASPSLPSKETTDLKKPAEELRRAVKKSYQNLMKLLPINELKVRLYSQELLSSTQKSELDSSASLEKKITYFLDEILIPSLNIGYTRYLDEMLSTMNESDNVSTKILAEQLKTDITAAPAPTDTSVIDAGKVKAS